MYFLRYGFLCSKNSFLSIFYVFSFLRFTITHSFHFCIFSFVLFYTLSVLKKLDVRSQHEIEKLDVPRSRSPTRTGLPLAPRPFRSRH